MNVIVLIDGQKLFLNPFMTTLTANVVAAVARSLKAPEGSRFEFVLKEEELELAVDHRPVDLNLGRAKKIVGNLLRGLLASLHGAESGREFRFIYEASAE